MFNVSNPLKNKMSKDQMSHSLIRLGEVGYEVCYELLIL